MCSILYSNGNFEFHLALGIGNFQQNLHEQLFHSYSGILSWLSESLLDIWLKRNVLLWHFLLIKCLYQGLIQNEKVHINCEKGAQISILAKQDCKAMVTQHYHKESKQLLHYINFLFSCYVHIMLQI